MKKVILIVAFIIIITVILTTLRCVIGTNAYIVVIQGTLVYFITQQFLDIGEK